MCRKINGDELERLTAADMGTEEYERVLGVLRSFQKNIELDYIYGIRDNGNGTFSFTIDPSSQDPGEFNEPVVATQALKAAATGTPSVDQTPYADNWGRFYSAYSPVFDSRGEIAGIVGVDFNADRYDSRIGSYRTVSLILLIAVLSIGIVLAVLLIHLY